LNNIIDNAVDTTVKLYDNIYKKGDTMSDSDEKQRALDASMENEGNRDLTPMVQISIKEYDKLKERSKYITDRDMIGCIDKIEELVRALRKHIVRTDIE
jgi:hypothetical protein